MGVLYDYFRAAGDTAAVALMDEFGGGPAAGDKGGLDAVDLKGIEPTVNLGKLIAIVLDVPWRVDLVETELLWRGDEEGPWLVTVGGVARDTLAAVEPGQVPGLAAQWGRTEELAWNGPSPDDHLVPMLEDLIGLARRARDAGEHLYCWCCL